MLLLIHNIYSTLYITNSYLANFRTHIESTAYASFLLNKPVLIKNRLHIDLVLVFHHYISTTNLNFLYEVYLDYITYKTNSYDL